MNKNNVKMNESIKSGLGFGLTSGIITTLGLMVGLASGTESQLAVIGGVLTIAFADAFSDALGMHIAKEAENHHTIREVWEGTLATFVAKLIIASTFLVPIFFFNLISAIAISVGWGILLLTILSLYLADQQNIPAWKVVLEHLSVAIIVIILSSFIGSLIKGYFK